MFVLTLTSLSFWSQKSRPSDSVYGLTPPGYDHNSLVCKVEITDAPYRGVPERWTEQRRDMYQEYYDTFMEMAVKKEIDDNPAIALRQLTLARPYTSRKPERPGDMDTEEEQFIELGYGAVIDNWEMHFTEHTPCLRFIFLDIHLPVQDKNIQVRRMDTTFIHSMWRIPNVQIFAKVQ